MAKCPIIESVDITERMAQCRETLPDDAAHLLREFEASAAAKASLTPAQQEDYDTLRALVENVARYRLPGATSDHTDLYDANGLPV